jgi:SAM-dependent methyltransferase
LITRTVSIEDLARLKAEREDADRRYNEALTALDAALPQLPSFPHPPPAPDEHQVTPLNERWRIVSGEAPGSPGNPIVRRLKGLVWGIVAPFLERQQAFNSALVDHINRNVAVGRATRESIEASLHTLEEQLAAVLRFHSALIVYLQQLTPYVDTKDYEAAGLARRITEDAREVLEMLDVRTIALDNRTAGLSGAISGVSDELLKRWESMVAREKRYDSKVAGLAATHHELRGAIGVLQQATHTLRRELERVTQQAAGSRLAAAQGADTEMAGVVSGSSGVSPTSGHLDSWKYVGFEDRFRGSEDEIRARLEAYVPLFENASDVLDVGCGRGEFLELLKARGITARGLDLNHEMVEVCRARGLEAAESDALGYLRGLPEASLGGLFAAQVVEHLEPGYLLALLDEAYHKLRPGSAIVLETINPACWFAFFSSYIRDLTHVRPIHPDTLSYLLTASGFQHIEVRYSAPYPERNKLRRVPGKGVFEDAFNANVDKLNALMFTYLDYAAIGIRL